MDNVNSDLHNWEAATAIIDKTTKDWLNDFNTIFREQVIDQLIFFIVMCSLLPWHEKAAGQMFN